MDGGRDNTIVMSGLTRFQMKVTDAWPVHTLVEQGHALHSIYKNSPSIAFANMNKYPFVLLKPVSI